MQEEKQQLIARLKEANNVLVTVSNNPTVDQLSAVIGLTLALNKMKKHATAVFSGKVPSAIDFLEPEKMIAKTTDSLRDFIVSLDRNKADKLRYKVEDKLVRIYISPYRAAIDEDDLTFSQGDFNVDVVVALGVKEQKDLDQAITAHGRILHDATVATVTTSEPGVIGSIHWADNTASSLSEMLTSAIQELQENILDGQIATALLTGIVAETDRFSNERTRPSTMAVSSSLMAAGANQQLVSEKLTLPPPTPPVTRPDPQPDLPAPMNEEQSQPIPEPAGESLTYAKQDQGEQGKKSDDDGVLRINHDELEPESDSEDSVDSQGHSIHIDEHGNLYDGSHVDRQDSAASKAAPPATLSDAAKARDSLSEHPSITKKSSRDLVTEPPQYQVEGSGLPGTDDAATQQDDKDSKDSYDPLAASNGSEDKTLTRGEGASEASTGRSGDLPVEQDQGEVATQPSLGPENVNKVKAADGPQTLADIETSVGAHQQQQDSASPSNDATAAPTNVADFGQMPTAPNMEEARQAIIEAAGDSNQESSSGQQSTPPGDYLGATNTQLQQQPANQQEQAPPPVPPPMMPPQQ